MILKFGSLIRKHKRLLLIILIMFSLVLFHSLLLNKKVKLVPNIIEKSMRKPSEGRNVFFHETSGKFKLNARQACAVESAGNHLIYMIYLIVHCIHLQL